MSRKISSLTGVLILVFILGLTTRPGWAQNSKIQGTVTDESGGIIPGVEVTVKAVATGISRSVITNDLGFYSVPLLNAGRYVVSIAMTGFATAQVEILLDPGQEAEHDFRLSVGVPTTVVEVKSSAARINTKPLGVGTVIEEKQIHELPLDGRNYLTLVNTVPGILKGAQGGRGEATADEGGYRSGGLPFDQTAILVDGVDNAARHITGPLATQAQTLKPAVEAVSEFKVITNNVSAEYGYKAGATVLVSTKSGTNRFHGTAYNFHRNGAQAANNFMFNRDGPRDPDTNELTTSPPHYIRNQFGGSFGGPVIKDKTFFFFSMQVTRLREGEGSFLRRVPSRLALSGDFSQEIGVPGRGNRIYDPLTLVGTGEGAERQPFPNNVLPPERMDPAAVQVLSLFPSPNIPGEEFEVFNYFSPLRTTNDNEVMDVRVDHNFNDNHRVFGRYSYRNEDRIRASVLPFPARSGNFASYKGRQLAVNYNATLGPRMHNELRGGLTRFPARVDTEYKENLNAKFGIKGAAVDQFPELFANMDADLFSRGLMFFEFGELFVPGQYENLGGQETPVTSKLNSIYFADNFLFDVGKHSLKAGGEYRDWRSDRSAGMGFGRMRFGNAYTAQFPNSGDSRGSTGHQIADALLGWPNSTFNSVPSGEDFSNPYWGFYVQDDWRVTKRLTINLGLRWELFGQPRAQDLGPANFIGKPVFEGAPWDETSDILPVLRFVRWEFPEGPGDCGCVLNLNNWAPRIGIAYRLTNDTVIRAGAGLYYSEDGSAQQMANRFLAGGAAATTNTFHSFETADVKLSDGFPPMFLQEHDVDVYNAGFAIFNPDYQPTVNTGQWFLDIQHQLPWDILVTLGYNGLSASHMPWWARNLSWPVKPGITPAGTRRRIPPPSETNTPNQLGGFFVNSNNLDSNYNAFTAKVEKRFSDGLSFLSSFTWGKSLDYGVASLNEIVEQSGGPNDGPVSPYIKDLWRNHGPSALQRDFAYSLSALYELPAGPGRGHLESGPASWVLGGWQLGTILTLQSGPWVTTEFAPNRANAGGTYRGILVGELNLPESERDSMRWFNREAVAAGPNGEHGDVGRGLLEGPGWKNVDFLLSKNFFMPWEGHRIQFRFEAFNLTNTPHFAPPSTATGFPSLNVNSPTSVRILQADQPRIIQFALKYEF